MKLTGSGLMLFLLLAGCAMAPQDIHTANVQAVSEVSDAKAQYDKALLSIEGDAGDYPAKVTNGISQLKALAEQGYAPAQSKLAYYYYTGPASYDCLKQDLDKAFYWYEKGAKQNYREAQYEFAMLFNPKSGPKKYINQAKYVAWMKKAADGGYAKAQYALGRMHEKGEYVKKDASMATALYQKAAAQGDGQARKALKRLAR